MVNYQVLPIFDFFLNFYSLVDGFSTAFYGSILTHTILALISYGFLAYSIIDLVGSKNSVSIYFKFFCIFLDISVFFTTYNSHHFWSINDNVELDSLLYWKGNRDKWTEAVSEALWNQLDWLWRQIPEKSRFDADNLASQTNSSYSSQSSAIEFRDVLEAPTFCVLSDCIFKKVETLNST